MKGTQLTHAHTHTHMHAHTPWLAHLMDRFALYSKNIPRGKGPYNCFLPSELWQALVHNCCLLLPPSSPSCSSSSVSTCYSYFNLLFLILHLIFPLPALMWSFSNATLFFFFFGGCDWIKLFLVLEKQLFGASDHRINIKLCTCLQFWEHYFASLTYKYCRLYSWVLQLS